MLALCMANDKANDLTRTETILRALANRRRLKMILALRHRHELHVSGLADELRVPLKTVSRNLRLLERCGIVVSEFRQGHAFYDSTLMGRC